MGKAGGRVAGTIGRRLECCELQARPPFCAALDTRLHDMHAPLVGPQAVVFSTFWQSIVIISKSISLNVTPEAAAAATAEVSSVSGPEFTKLVCRFNIWGAPCSPDVSTTPAAIPLSTGCVICLSPALPAYLCMHRCTSPPWQVLTWPMPSWADSGSSWCSHSFILW